MEEGLVVGIDWVSAVRTGFLGFGIVVGELSSLFILMLLMLLLLMLLMSIIMPWHLIYMELPSLSGSASGSAFYPAPGAASVPNCRVIKRADGETAEDKVAETFVPSSVYGGGG